MPQKWHQNLLLRLAKKKKVRTNTLCFASVNKGNEVSLKALIRKSEFEPKQILRLFHETK